MTIYSLTYSFPNLEPVCCQTRREHSPGHQQNIGLKIYWAWPIRTRFSFPLSLSHQEAAISLLPYPSEGRQNENHNHRKLIKLITWTTALSNSMKLWTMTCRATQDRQVMLDSSDKTWSTGEGNEWQTTSVFLSWVLHEQYEKAKRYDTRKMNSPGR